MWKSVAEETDLKDAGSPDNLVNRDQVPPLRGPDIFSLENPR